MRKQSPKPLTGRIAPACQTAAFLALAALALIPQTSRSAVTVWDGDTNRLWSDAANWSLGEPTSADDAIFPSVIPSLTVGGGILLSAGEVANSLTFRNGYTLFGGDLTLSTGVTPQSGFITVASTFTTAITSRLMGTGSITLASANGLAGGDAQNGGGTLDLLGNNSYSGGTNLSSGQTLGVGSATALGTGLVNINGAGTLSAVNGNHVVVNNVSVNSNFTLGRGTTSDGLDLAGAVGLGTGSRTITVNNFQQRISGEIFGTNTAILVKNGAGDLFLLAANGYGDTIVNNGSLRLIGAGTAGSDFLGNDVTIASGGAGQLAMLRLQGPSNFGGNQILTIDPRADGTSALGLGTGFAEGTGNTIDFNTAGTGLQNIRLLNTASEYAAIVLDGIRYADDVIGKAVADAPLTFNTLGATTLNGVFSGTTLTPSAGAYRLGGGGGTLTIEKANVLSGAANLVVGSHDATNRGAGLTAFIPQAQSFTGTITIGSGGNLIVGSNASLGNAANNPINLAGGTIDFRVTGVHGQTDSQYLSRNLNITADSTINTNPLGGAQFAAVQVGSLTSNGGARNITFNNGNSFDLRVTGPVVLNPAATPVAFNATFTVNSGFVTLEQPVSDSGLASGAASLVKAGGGTLILAADNTYQGTTTVNAGTLTLLNPSATNAIFVGAGNLDLRSDAGGVVNFPAVTLNNAGRTINVDRITDSGTPTDIRLASLSAIAAATDVLITGQRGWGLSVAGATTIASNFTFNVRSAQLELLGGITDGAGSFNVTKGDINVLKLSGAGTYDGTTTIGGGTIIANHTDVGGVVDVFGTSNTAINFTGTGATALLIQGAGTLNRNFTNSATGGTQVIGGLDAGAKVFTGTIAATRTTTLTAAVGGDTTFSGVISGAGGINVGTAVTGVLVGIPGTPAFGRGTVFLNPTLGTGNTFTGGLAVNNGTVVGQAQATSGSPFGAGAITVNDGTLRLDGNAGASTTTNTTLTVGGGANVVVNDPGTAGTTTLAVSSLARAVAGTPTFAVGTVALIPFTGSADEIVTIGTAPQANGIILPWAVRTVSNANRAADYISLSGTTVVTATYTGNDINVSNSNTAVINDTDGGTLTSGRAAYALRLGADLNAGGFTLDIGDQAVVGSLGGIILNAGADITNGTLDFGISEGAIYVDDAGTSTISANITSALVPSIANSLTKFGAGTLILSGTDNSYRGATVINRGTLEMGSVNALGRFVAGNVQNATAVTVGGQGILNLAGFATEAGSLSGDFGSQVDFGGATFTVGRNNLSTTFSGQLNGNGGTLIKLGTGTLIVDNTRADIPNTLTNLIINQGTVRNVVMDQVVGSPFAEANSIPATTAVTLRGGTFAAVYDGDNQTTQQSSVSGQSFVVSGGNSEVNVNRAGSTAQNKLIEFNSLTLNRNQFSLNGGNNISAKFTGPVTMTDIALITTPTFGTAMVVDGIISDGGNGFTLNKTGNFSLEINNPANSWSGGTILYGGGSTLLFGSRGTDPVRYPGATFVPNHLARAGTGDIVVNTGATIRLNAPTNLAVGQEVRIISSALQTSSALFEIRTDRPLADYNLRSFTPGALGIGSGGAGGSNSQGVFSEALNLAGLGNGEWGISGTQDTLYTASSLGVGANNLYRFFGSGGGVLIIEDANVVTGTAGVTLGRSLVDFGSNFPVNTQAVVRFNTDQNYTGNTLLRRAAAGATVNNGQIGTRLEIRGTLASPVIEVYGRLQADGNGRFTNDAGVQVNDVQLRAGGSVRLDYDTGLNNFLLATGAGSTGANAGAFTNKWQDNLAMTLNGSTVNLVNTNAAQTVENIGSINYGGGSEIFLERRGTNGQPILAINGTLNRIDLGTLALRVNINGDLGRVVAATGSGDTQRVVLVDPANAPARITPVGAPVSMVSPQFFDYTANQFVDYDTTANIGYSRGFVSLVPTSSNNATFTQTGGTANVSIDTTAVTQVTAGADVLALRVQHNVSDAENDSITIRSGGLAATAAGGVANTTTTVSVPLIFGVAGAPVEADIWTNTTASVVLGNTITAANLTKNGPGRLVLGSGTATTTNVLTGNMQLNGGTVELRGSPTAGTIGTIRLHGAYLNNQNGFQMPRLELRADSTNATTSDATRQYSQNIVTSNFLPYAELFYDRAPVATAGTSVITIPTLTIENGGSDGTVLSFQNGNDFDLTVTGLVTLGLPGNTAPVGLNVQNNNATNQVIFNSQVVGASGVVKTGNGPLRFNNAIAGQLPNTFAGGITVDDGTMELFNTVVFPATTQNNLQLAGTGPIVLNRGLLRLGTDSTNTGSNVNFASLDTNNLTARGHVGIEFTRPTGSAQSTSSLGGNLAVFRTENSGHITINPAVNQVAIGQWNGRTEITDNPIFNLIGNEFRLGNASGPDSITGQGHIYKTGSGLLTFNSGGSNSFSGGLDITQGHVRVITTTDTFGNGPIRVSPDGVIGVQANTSLVNNNQITNFHANSTALAGLSLRASGLVPTTFLNAANITTAAGNGGLLAIDATVTTAVNLGTLYDGFWNLGSAASGGTYNATTLGVGANNTYRLGGGGATLTMGTTVNLLTGTAKLVVGKGHALLGNGTVVLQNNNNYSGGTTINRSRDVGGGFTVSGLNIQSGVANTPMGTGAVEVYGNLQFEGSNGTALNAAGNNQNAFSFHPGARLIFENNTPYTGPSTEGRFDDQGAVALRSSSLELVGDDSANVNNTETIGAVSYEGGSTLRSSRRTTFGSELNVASLTRVGTGTLTFDHDAGLLGINNTAANVSAGSGVNRVKVADATFATNNTANGMVNPYIISRTDSQFLKYDATVGFQLITQGGAPANYVATSATTIDGTLINPNDGTRILSYDGTGATALGANLDLHALRLQGDINSSANGLFNTITVRSGGVTIYGGTGRSINANVIFGTAGTPVEALIHASSQNLNFNGQLTAAGLTKFGTSSITISQDQPGLVGAINVNQGSLVAQTPGALGVNNVINLNGWTGNSGQTTTELRLNFNPGTPDELVFTSGKITSLDHNLIRAQTASDRIVRIAAVDLTTTSGTADLKIPGVVRFQVDGSRSELRTGIVTLFDNYNVHVDAGSFGPGSTVAVRPDQINNAGTFNLTKTGDAVLSLPDISTGFTGSTTLTVNEGAVRALTNGSLGGSGVTAIIDNGGALEIATAGFAPAATLVQRAGSIERWAVNGARAGAVTLGSGVHLQIASNQTGTQTIDLNGGSIMGYLPVDLDEVAVIHTLGAGVSINLTGDSLLGQPYPAGTNAFTGQQAHLYYDMGKANQLNNPLDPRLNGSYLQILGNITGAQNLTKVGQDMILLAGTNSYNNTTIREGILQVGSAGALPSTKRVTLQADGVLDMNGFDTTIGSLAGSSSANRVVNGATTVETLAAGNDDTSTVYAGSISGSIALVKQGLGTMTLANANTYIGNTTVDGGTLLANNSSGSATGSGDVSVNNANTLGGTGSVAGNVTVNSGGTLAPGETLGTLGIGGNLNFADGSTFAVQLGGTTPGDGAGFYDQANVAGSISLNSDAEITLSLVNAFVANPSDSFFVLTQGGVTPFASTFAGAADNSTIDFGNGITAQITYDANWTGLQGTSTLDGGNDVALFNVVPEPGAFTSLLGGMATLLGLQRFRRRRI